MGKRLMYKVMVGFLALQAPASFSLAGDIGSTTDVRRNTDTASGGVYIFAGDCFSINQQIVSFAFQNSNDPFPDSRLITPILLEQTASGPNWDDDIYVVRGVGTGRTIGDPGLFMFDFGLQYGTDQIPADGCYTFGFINALVDADGNVTSTSAGVVDFNEGMPDDGHGVSGQGTNDWRIVWPVLPHAISVGTTFGGGSQYPLNDRSSHPWLDDRTYSAFATSQ
jgi:hypothetical protein